MKYRRRYILFVVVLALLCGLSILNYYNKVFACNTNLANKNDDSGFSIMTFNVAAYEPLSLNEELKCQLIEMIEEKKPDILCFQELSSGNLEKIKPQLDSIYGPCEMLKGEDQMCRYMFFSHFPLRHFSKHKCLGDIEISDMTEEELAYMNWVQRQMYVMSAEFEVKPGKWIKLFSGHLRSSAYSTARRSMDKDASWFDGISLYKRNYEVGKRIRDYEAENVRRFVDDARADGKPVIVAGDLNDWCGSDCLNTLMGDDLKDAWWEGGNGFGWTYFGWHLRLRLDHILFSDELELVDVKVVDTDISDHKPLMARFRIK